MAEDNQFLDSKAWGNPELKGLIEVSPPQEISWWPQTSGWLAVLLIVTLLVFMFLLKAFKNYQRNAYRRKAILELENLKENPNTYVLLPQLLKRVALYAYSREDVGSLVGENWEVWLDNECNICAFSTEYKGMLNQLAHGDRQSLEKSKFNELARQVKLWINTHEGEK
ncbi:DUF4381 domain-containing protein (plasmid) [Photobacterium sp. DA100]|uniref:DUF4381 domain-containing protein n=1 Tax=Photobacterium sp. DA100 TaxID=3027472 RepID=UPI002479221D|nr:DUF4381 domain-containing protein [Photobacterium sp. DA100]WEM44305.1 DUF4381 domain-containing protein [Photobacterium sp. DA100]